MKRRHIAEGLNDLVAPGNTRFCNLVGLITRNLLALKNYFAVTDWSRASNTTKHPSFPIAVRP